MKYIEKELSFTKRKTWAWPDEDEKLIQVFDQVNDIDYIMEFVDSNGTCIQAGGACGIWPLKYAQYFNLVLTFEPNKDNMECLLENIDGTDNILVSDHALWDSMKQGSMYLHPSELNNSGAYYFKEGNQLVDTLVLDSLDLEEVDLIQLDIEGAEYQALKGAENTIKHHKPVIVIEEKPLPQMETAVREARIYLESLGYREVGHIHRDVVFKMF